MSGETQTATPVPTLTPGDDDWLSHVVCCVNEKVALCGRGLPDEDYWPAVEGSAPNPCVVCQDIFRGDSCPVLGRCRDGFGEEENPA